MISDSLVTRSVAFPKMFPGGALALEALFKFDTEDERRYILSIGIGHLLPSDESRHAFGCKVVEAMNKSLKARLGRPLVLEETSFYVGYYYAAYGDLLSVMDPSYTLCAYWEKEGSLVEHGHIEYRDNGSALSAKQKKLARRSLRKRIVRKFSGPVRGSCKSYGEDLAHLFAVPLPSAPFEPEAEE